jgi:hypothetical protein
MTNPAIEFHRVDPLTGCHNFLSFVAAPWMNLLMPQSRHSSAQKTKEKIGLLRQYNNNTIDLVFLDLLSLAPGITRRYTFMPARHRLAH